MIQSAATIYRCPLAAIQRSAVEVILENNVAKLCAAWRGGRGRSCGVGRGRLRRVRAYPEVKVKSLHLVAGARQVNGYASAAIGFRCMRPGTRHPRIAQGRIVLENSYFKARQVAMRDHG